MYYLKYSIFSTLIFLLLLPATGFGQITIDGLFDDWDGLGTVIGANGSVTLTAYDEDNILYLYISGSDLVVTNDIYLDIDCDSGTGYNGGNVWDATGQGADVLLQGAFSYSSPYTTGNGTLFTWNSLGGIAFNPNSYDPGMITDIEFAFPLSPGCGSISIGACVTDGGAEYCLPTGNAYTEYILLDPLLPVELVSFKGNAAGLLSNQLNWVTASEKDNDHFLIQKSEDGHSWEDVEKITGKGTTTFAHQYEWIDKDPFAVTYYRLKQIDYSGDFEFSPIISVENERFSNIKISPNPATELLTVSFEEERNETEQVIKIYNQLGIELSNKVGIENLSSRLINFDISTLDNGLYYLRIGRLSYPFLVMETH